MDDVNEGVVDTGSSPSSPPVVLRVGQVWTRGSEKRTIRSFKCEGIVYEFPDVTNGEVRNTGGKRFVERSTFLRWILGDKRRGQSKATLETNTDIPDHEFTPPRDWVPSQLAVGPQEGEWDTGHGDDLDGCPGCEEGLTDDEYEGRHEPVEPDVVVIEDDGHQD